MTITIGGVNANSSSDCTIPPKTVLECNAALTAPAGDGVARRGRSPDGDGGQSSGVADGLSIGHISPLSCEESEKLRIVSEYWADTPSVAQWRNGEGSLVAGEGRAGSVEWTPDGSFLKVRKPSVFAIPSSSPSSSGASLRGAVSGFSNKSRSRLMQLTAKVKRGLLPFFLTLTYPGKSELVPWDNPEQWKRDLIDKFSKRLVRRFPQASAIWKLEPQKRGAPHFHLLLWLQVPGMNQAAVLLLLRSWVRLAWWECVGQCDSDHFKAGTSVEPVRSWHGVCFYAAKYLGKAIAVDNDAWGRPGRWWGVINRACLPLAALMMATLFYTEACDLMRWLRRFRRLKGRDAASMWAVVSDPDAWIDALERHIRG